MANREHPEVERSKEIRTAEALRRKIRDRIRVDEAVKPSGPLRILKVTTST